MSADPAFVPGRAARSIVLQTTPIRIPGSPRFSGFPEPSCTAMTRTGTSVDDIFTLTGVGTVFVGKVLTGSISIGDRIVCRTPSTDVPVRVIAVQDGSGKPLKRGEPGILIGVVCNTIDLAALPGTNAGSADIGQVVGVRLVTAPEKKRWWQ